jgi:hypothetical protein
MAPGGHDVLETISESPLVASTVLEALLSEKSPSFMSHPIFVIIQYGVMIKFSLFREGFVEWMVFL